MYAAKLRLIFNGVLCRSFSFRLHSFVLPISSAARFPIRRIDCLPHGVGCGDWLFLALKECLHLRLDFLQARRCAFFFVLITRVIRKNEQRKHNVFNQFFSTEIFRFSLCLLKYTVSILSVMFFFGRFSFAVAVGGFIINEEKNVLKLK